MHNAPAVASLRQALEAEACTIMPDPRASLLAPFTLIFYYFHLVLLVIVLLCKLTSSHGPRGDLEPSKRTDKCQGRAEG